ncbi:MAG: Cna B-type domain-containing protein [Coriobacteriales bacterium]|jgi:hypothetical protein|nr:Cna B-type domain-containing protein [Coriobacteriales bacterium]
MSKYKTPGFIPMNDKRFKQTEVSSPNRSLTTRTSQSGRIVESKQSKRLTVRALLLSLSLVLVFVLAVVQGFAQSFFQEVVNKFVNDPRATVELVLYERDRQGNATEIAIPRAEFFLYKVNDQTRSDDTLIGGPFYTDAEGRIDYGKIELGSYYFVETNPTFGFVYDTDSQGLDITKYPFEIAALKTHTVVIAYNQRLIAPLIISKIVVNADGSDLTLDQLALEFEFKVIFSDGGTYPYTASDGSLVYLTSGDVIKLRHGQIAVFDDLPKGLQYSVTELPVPGYQVYSQGHQGNISDDSSSAAFINTYMTASGSLVITKLVTGADWLNDSLGSGDESGGDSGAGKPGGGAGGPGGAGGAGGPGGAGGAGDAGDGDLESGVLDGGEPGGSAGGTDNSEPNDGGLKPDSSETPSDQKESDTPADNGILDNTGNNPQTDGKEQAEYLGPEFELTLSFSGLPSYPITILVDGEPFSISALDNQLTLTIQHSQSIKIEGLPVGTTYLVVEQDYSSEGYTSVPQLYSGQIIEGEIDLLFTNHYQGRSNIPGSLEISKTVINPDDQLTLDQADQLFEFKLTFSDLPDNPVTILIDGERFELSNENYELEFTLRHSESLLIEGLPAGIGYTISEAPCEGYIALIETAKGKISTGFSTVIRFVNLVYADVADQPTVLVVEKLVEGKVPVEMKDYNFKFILSIEGQEPIEFELKADQSKVFTGLTPGLYYTVLEVDVYYDGFILTNVVRGSGTLSAEPAENLVTFTNTRLNDAPLEITGEKTWDLAGFYHDIPGSIIVLLMNGEEVVESIEVIADENGIWSYSFTVPKYDEQGYEIEYTIDEVPVPGFEAQVDGFDITNVCLDEEKIVIEGKKLWDLQGYKVTLPESITVDVLIGNRIVASIEVRPDAKGDWRYSVELPKYASDGSLISYSVREVPVYGYSSQVDGMDITNTYEPPKPVYPDIPETGDDLGVIGTIAVVNLFVLGLVSLTLWNRYRKLFNMQKAWNTYGGDWRLHTRNESELQTPRVINWHEFTRLPK